MAKPPVAPIVSDHIRLRLLERADLPMTRSWRNQDDVRKWFLRPDVITEEQHRAWFAQYAERDDDFVFVIEETNVLNRPVGQAAIYNVERGAGRAEFGRLMIGDAAARGRGLARSATQALVDHAFTAWGLREIYLEVIESNVAARAVYEACGFTVASHLGSTVTMRRETVCRNN